MKTIKLLVVTAFLAGLVSSAVAGPSPDWIASQERIRKEQQAQKAAVPTQTCTKTCACAEMKK
jgi:hypothetical protein